MTGSPSGRADRLVAALATAGPDETPLDALLVTNLVNVEYLTGFTGTNGACIVSGERRMFLTDFRYAERASEIEGWDVEIVSGQWLEGLASRLSGRTGFEDDQVTVRTANQIREAADAAEMVEAGGQVERLRRVKDSDEIERIAEAARMTDELYRLLLDDGLAGRTEAEVDGWLTGWMREQGAEPSFPPIVASGPNGASPHAEPGPREIGTGEMVTIDMGVRLDGYCSDCTRTFATGGEAHLDSLSREIYEVTLRANEAGLAAIRAGEAGSAIDEVARAIIREAGYGGNFGHGLGHGVGVEIHEAPRLGPSSQDVLMAGEVVTDEPGIYISGATGVRIEDMVLVGEEGVARNFCSIPKQLTFV
ncbi:MAG: aminopeptidase P family protein [Solirubrobacterales bacterium]|nr:aminopeptidase P family protein [Solirubrobacterales bacterium]MCB8915277.1 M24 family metallopeptidase [Thermoleophilales bacterium]